jgi:rhodanese-related sulfurtransferase
MEAEGSTGMAYGEVDPQEALRRYESGEPVILDVRTPVEWAGAHIPGAVHIPLDELTRRYQELDPDAETIVVCAHGIRSAAAGQWLSEAGFECVLNLRHGLSRWPGPIRSGLE